jgi:hypothetical protein
LRLCDAMFAAFTASLPSVFVRPGGPDCEHRGSKDDDSSYSTRLYEEYAPPESVRNDPKVASSYVFHGEAAVE